MGVAIALTLLVLRGELDALYPGRDRRSDGLIADSHHASTSDHYPHDDPADADPTRWVCALDFDNDIGVAGVNAWTICNELSAKKLAGGLPQLKYLVSGIPGSGRDLIFSDQLGRSAWAWRDKGSSDHVDHHGHVSVYNTAQSRNVQSLWLAKNAAVVPPILWQPLKGSTVKTGLVTITLDDKGRGWKDVCAFNQFVALTPHGNSPENDGYRRITPQFAVQDRGGKARVEVIGGALNGVAQVHVTTT